MTSENDNKNTLEVKQLYKEASKAFLLYFFILGCSSYNSYDGAYFDLGRKSNPSISKQTTYQEEVALHKALGEKYYSDHQYHLAVTEFSTAIQIAPGDASAYEGLGRSHRGLGEYEKAIETLNKGIALFPVSSTSPVYARLHNSKAVIYDMMGKHEKAIVEYEKAIKLDSTNDSYYNNKGFSFLLEIQGRHGQADRQVLVEESISAFKKALEVNPANRTAHANLGYAYGLKHMYELTLKEFMLAGDEAAAYNNLGYIYTKNGKLSEAIESYNNALKINPNLSFSYYSKGRAYELMGDVDNAVMAYQEFIKQTTYTSAAEEAFNRIQFLKKKKKEID